MASNVREQKIAIEPGPVAGELARAIAQAAADAERARWSGSGQLAMAIAAALLVAAPLIPGAQYVLGGVTTRTAFVVVGPAWIVFELAALSFHVGGARSAVHRLLAALDELAQIAAPLVLVYLSGSASSLLSFVGMLRAYGWTPTSAAHERLTVTMYVASHLALIVAFFATGRPADASLIVLILLGSIPIHGMAKRISTRSVRARAERLVVEERLHAETLRGDRDRIARELHDGVGADVMALVLRLRRASEEGTHPTASRLAARAARVLDDLRAAVWSLRNEQGTLAELGKLVDAACRRACGSVAHELTVPADQATHPVGPSAALTALRVTGELAASAAAREGATRVRVILSIADELEVAVEDDAGHRQRVTIPLDPLPSHPARA